MNTEQLAEILADVADVETIALGPHDRVLDACRHCRTLAAEVERLRAILDTPREALFANGRQPTENERHLLNLLSWRQKESVEDKADVERLRFMLQYASEAPDQEACCTVCRDALNGVTGAENVQQVRSEVERLRAAMERIAESAPHLSPCKCGPACSACIAREALEANHGI